MVDLTNGFSRWQFIISTSRFGAFYAIAKKRSVPICLSISSIQKEELCNIRL